MSLAAYLCKRRFSIVEETVETWREEHDQAMLVCDIEELGEEFVRTVEFFKRSYDRTVQRLLDGKLRDINAGGKQLLRTAETGLQAGDALIELFAKLRQHRYNLPNESGLLQARSNLADLKNKLVTKWPFLDPKAFERSREDFERGRFRTCGEPLDGTKSKSA